MNVLGVKIINHDTGACCISNGKVVAISEERLNRIKHSPDIFPNLSIEYCLSECGLKEADIDLIVIDQTGSRREYDLKSIFKTKTNGKFDGKQIEIINHHDAHAASAFFCSPYSESAVFVCDGAGEKIETHFGFGTTETESLYIGRGNKIFEIKKATHLRIGKIFPFTFGIGKLYSHVSNNYLGFGPYNEGKMMGLAPYGNEISKDNKIYKNILSKDWYIDRDNVILCNSNITYPKGTFSTRIRSLNTIIPFIRKKILLLIHRLVFFVLKRNKIFSPPTFFGKITLDRPPRVPDSKMPDEYYILVAYAIQCLLEKITVLWATKLRKITGQKNLCVSGGVALNIDANKKYYDEAGFENVFIQPASSDCGVPLGSALYGYHVIGDNPRFFVMETASMGRVYHNDHINVCLNDKIKYLDFYKSENVCREVARLISDGNIVAWFSGGSEYGPRALGNRSILCDARIKDMKDILNNRVKHRESWRPFATSILEDRVQEYFDINVPSPFMLLVANLKKDKIGSIPSVTHVDNTSRLQTVSEKNNKKYFDLIKAFDELTGVPLILNTSYNLGGDPIVETPSDAIETFLKTDIDFLVLEDYIIKKR